MNIEELLTPKYLVAVFNVIMLIFTYIQGYRTGSKRAARKIMDGLQVPPGYEISGIQYRKKQDG